MRFFTRRAILMGLGLSLPQARAESVDPKCPAEYAASRTTAPPPLSYWPPRRIHELEQTRRELKAQISHLPQHTPRALNAHFGYHSSFQTDDPTHPWIHWTSNRPHLISAIALVPALKDHPSGPTAYAFPKRFVIETRPTAEAPFKPLVDWTEEDFPNPGPYPVFFADLNQQVQEIRLTATDGHPFALGEIYFFRYRKGHLGTDNIASWFGRTIETANAFRMSDHWNTEYLSDRVTGLGLPLSDPLAPSNDLLIFPNPDEQSDSIRLTLDLQQAHPVEHIDLWSALPPADLLLPGLGFPHQIDVECSTFPDFIPSFTPMPADIEGDGQSGRVLTIRMRRRTMRYIRLTMTGLQSNQTFHCWGLGEIRVCGETQTLSRGCRISAEGLPARDTHRIGSLVDGLRGGCRILKEMEWIKGLAQRRPLDQRLHLVETQLRKTRTAWHTLQMRAAYLGASATVLLLAGLVIAQRRQRLRALKRLREQITRDLHDDVGSNLGSISLATQRLETAAVSPAIKRDLGSLSLMVKEACASLREVVWVIDQETLLLPELLQKLFERAERVLSPVDLEIELPADCPAQEVSLSVKRHLIMFFKEVVHNCAKHANASSVQITATSTAHHLALQIRDNGCGFDPAQPTRGWGLKNMKKRAAELGGTITIISQADAGTSITFSLPLNALSQEPKRPYATSN